MPQGSILGPTLFSCYSSTLKDVMHNRSESIWGYADDNTFVDKFKVGQINDEETCVKHMENLLVEIKTWMTENWLKMNDSKTEFLYFGHPKQIDKTVYNEINVMDCTVRRSDAIRLLGFTLDSRLTCKQHIKNKCLVALTNINRIKKISKYISLDSGKVLASALILSHFDYGNALLTGLPKSTLKPMQLLQNYAAKVLTKRCKYDSATEALKELHWLPIQQRCEFKTTWLRLIFLNY